MVRLGLLDRRHCDSNISINNDPMHANEGSTDSSRRQLQFGTVYDVFFCEAPGAYEHERCLGSSRLLNLESPTVRGQYFNK
jgi:hypothetical protein